MPLYVPEALCVELALAAFGARVLPGAVAAGVGIGTLGSLGEYAWTHAVFPLPWTTAMFPEGLVLAVIGGVAGASLGALLALGFRGQLPAPRVARAVAAVSLAALVGCAADGLVISTPVGAKATVTLADVSGGIAHRTTVRLDPASLASGDHYVTVTAWQGKGRDGVGRDVYRMKRTGPATFVTTEPLPLTGGWKSFVRLQKGRAVIGVPVRMPADDALTGAAAAAVRAPSPSATRTFVHDQKLLQRERKPDIPSWLWTAACLVVGAFFAVFITAICLGIGRVGRASPRRTDREPRHFRGRRMRPVAAPAPQN
jgi:hypothetical protein